MDNSTRQSTLLALTAGGGGALTPFLPVPLCPPPPLYRSNQELAWLDAASPCTSPRPLLPPRPPADAAASAELRRLLTLARREALSISQHSRAVTLLRVPGRAPLTGLRPGMLERLVEHNLLVAVEFLLSVRRDCDAECFHEFLMEMVKLELSLHSVEVVNRLTTAVELPYTFIHTYINYCITTCRDIADRYMQNRLVRLVCVFLQSLVRNRVICARPTAASSMGKDLLVLIAAFCVEFSRIREAAALYKLLKQRDFCEPA